MKRSLLAIVALTVLGGSWSAAQEVPQPRPNSQADISEKTAIRGAFRFINRPSEATQYRAKWAVLVGIDAYPGGETRLEPLMFAENDAHAVRDILVDEFGYAEDHVLFLSDHKATRSAIEAAISDWLPAQGAAENDAVLFFFAGHGLIDSSDDEGFLAAVDSDANDLEGTCLSVSQVRDAVGRLPCRHKLVILDSCYSGSLFERRTAEPVIPAVASARGANPRGVDEPASSDAREAQRGDGPTPKAGDYLGYYFRQPAFMGMSAGRYTPVADGLGKQRHSVFTAALLEVLRERADTDRSDHAFTFRQLAAKVEERVAGSLNSRQIPDWGQLGPGGGDFVFHETVERLTPGERSQQRQALISVDRSLEEWAAGRHEIATHRLLQALRLAPGRGPVRSGIRNLLADRLHHLEVTVRHEGPISALAFSPDGTKLATASFDHSARLWDVATGQPIGEPMRHDDRVLAVSFSPDGRAILTTGAGRDRTLRLWSAADATPLRTPVTVHSPTSLLKFTPDGRKLLAGGHNAEPRLWSFPEIESLDGRGVDPPAPTGGGFGGNEPKVRINGMENPITGPVVFSPDGSLYYLMGHIWDSASGKPIRPISSLKTRIDLARFSPDGRTLLLSGLPEQGIQGGRVGVFDVETGRLRGELIQTENWVLLADFTPDSSKAAVVSDGDVLFLDVETGQPTGTTLHHPDPVLALAFSPDGGRLLLTGCQDGLVRLWDVATGQPIGEPMRHDDRVLAVGFGPEARIFASASADGTARVWGPLSRGELLGEPLTTIQDNFKMPSGSNDPEAPVFTPGAIVAATPDGSFYVQNGRVWDAGVGKPTGPALEFPPFRDPKCKLSPDGTTVLYSGLDYPQFSVLRFYDAREGRLLAEYKKGALNGYEVVFTPDGDESFESYVSEEIRIFATRSNREGSTRFGDAHGFLLGLNPECTHAALAEGEHGERVQVRDSTGAPLHDGLPHPDRVSLAAFSGDGQRIVTGCGSEVRLWEVKTGRQIGAILPQAGRVSALALNSDGAEAVVGCGDGTVSIWDLSAGKVRGKPFLMDDSVGSVGFAEDGRRAFALDGRLRYFDLETGKPVGEPIGDPVPEHVAEAPVGRVRAESRGRSAWIRKPAGGRPLLGPLHHVGPVHWLVFSPDGSALAVGGPQSARIWDVATAQPRGEPIPIAEEGLTKPPIFNTDGSRMLIQGYATARIVDVAEGVPRGSPLSHGPVGPDDRKANLLEARFSPDGHTALTIYDDHSARLWDTATGAPRGPALRHRLESSVANLLPAVAVRPDGKSVSVDLPTGRPLGNMASPALWNGPLLADFSPDSRWLATADRSKVQLWDVSTGLPDGREIETETPIRMLDVSADGLRLWVGDALGTLRWWDMATGRPSVEKFVHHYPVARLELSSNGSLTTYEERPAGSLGQMAIQSGTRPPARSWRWPVPETAIPEDLAVLEHLLTTRTRLRLDDLQEPAPVSLTEWSEAWKAVSDKSASTLQEFRQDADRSASIWTRAVAARCEDEGLWLAAHFHLDRLVETARREDADLLLRRANAEAELGLWDESTRDLSRVARLRPDSVHPKLLQAHIRLGQGDLDGYRTACRELRPLMANETDPQTLADYVRLASAVPGTLEAPQQLIELADRAASHYSGLWDVDLARKWAGIRSGHAREVVAACNQALGSGDIPGHIRLWAAVIAIAAEDQLGEPDKALVARETLEKVLRQSSRPNWRERAVIESVKRSGPS